MVGPDILALFGCVDDFDMFAWASNDVADDTFAEERPTGAPLLSGGIGIQVTLEKMMSTLDFSSSLLVLVGPLEQGC